MDANTNTAFIGRSFELDDLLAALPTPENSSQGCLKIISGSAGIGKSRLLAEISEVAQARNFRVLWSERVEDSLALPYFTWIQTLRSCLVKYVDDELIHDLGVGAADVSHLLPELQDRLKLLPGKPAEKSITAQLQMFDSVSRFFLASAKRCPLVLLLDNLHLADQSSLDLLEYFSQQISGYPILVIAAYRSLPDTNDEQLKPTLDRLTRNARFSHHLLDGLQHNEVSTLLNSFVEEPLPETLIKSIFQQSDGNPLFVVEVAKMLKRNALERPLPGPAFHFDVPESLREVILARLDSLTTETRNALIQASVLGREFSISPWQALVERNNEHMLNLVQDAEAADIIHSLRPGQYRFQHALYREVLYCELKKYDQAIMHLAAAKYLESYSTQDSESTSVLSQLAYHYFEVSSSGYADKAIHFNEKAASAAQEQHAYKESATFLEQALIAYELSSNTDIQKKFNLLLNLGTALFRTGQQKSAIEPLLQASILAQQACEWNNLAEALVELQFVCGQLGFLHESCLALHETLLDNLSDDYHPLRPRALASMADAQRLLGNYDLAATLARESIDLARIHKDPLLLLDCFCRGNWALGCSAVNPQALDYRRALSKEMKEIARVHGTMEEKLLIMVTISFDLCSKSSAAELQEHLSDFRQIMKTVYHPHYTILLAGFEISVNTLQGNWQQAQSNALVLRQKANVLDVAGLEGGFGQQMFVIQRAKGLLAGAASLIKRMESHSKPEQLWLPGQILLHCELENWNKARELFTHIRDLAKLKHDDMYLVSLIYLAESCVLLNDRLRLIELYKYLKPFRGVIAHIPGTVCMGAVSGYLALVAVRLNKKIRARELFEEALALNSKMAAKPWLARVQIEYAQFLLSSPNTDHHVRAQQLLISAKKLANETSLEPLLNKLKDIDAGIDIGQLTKRERTVLILIAKGLSNKSIALKLSVSLSTVATHVRNILRKLHVSNRTQATDYARQAALLD